MTPSALGSEPSSPPVLEDIPSSKIKQTFKRIMRVKTRARTVLAPTEDRLRPAGRRSGAFTLPQPPQLQFKTLAAPTTLLICLSHTLTIRTPTAGPHAEAAGSSWTRGRRLSCRGTRKLRSNSQSCGNVTAHLLSGSFRLLSNRQPSRLARVTPP